MSIRESIHLYIIIQGAAAPSASAEASPAQEEKPETPDVSKKKAESAPPGNDTVRMDFIHI